MTPVNYHVHTYLCDHATGSIDDYINFALKKGLKEIGFADHAPVPLRFREGITMEPEEVDFYISEISARQERYKNDIKIRLGFEVDFPIMDTFNTDLFSDSRMDFFIGSCHFLQEWPFDHADFVNEFSRRDLDDVYRSYYSIIESMADSGLFDIIGHFDLVKKFGHRARSDFSPVIERIAQKLSDRGTTVEINTSGIMRPVGEIYPSDDIIEILFRNNVPVTTSADSHAPEHIDFMLEKAIEKLKKAGYRKISGFENRKRYDLTI
jgi:histidinol-phosphatase (PHP family)